MADYKTYRFPIIKRDLTELERHQFEQMLLSLGDLSTGNSRYLCVLGRELGYFEAYKIVKQCLLVNGKDKRFGIYDILESKMDTYKHNQSIVNLSPSYIISNLDTRELRKVWIKCILTKNPFGRVKVK